MPKGMHQATNSNSSTRQRDRMKVGINSQLMGLSMQRVKSSSNTKQKEVPMRLNINQKCPRIEMLKTRSIREDLYKVNKRASSTSLRIKTIIQKIKIMNIVKKLQKLLLSLTNMTKNKINLINHFTNQISTVEGVTEEMLNLALLKIEDLISSTLVEMNITTEDHPTEVDVATTKTEDMPEMMGKINLTSISMTKEKTKLMIETMIDRLDHSFMVLLFLTRAECHLGQTTNSKAKKIFTLIT
jgi:hypothetical protein